MIRRPARSTRTDTLFPDTTLFRSQLGYQSSFLYGGFGSFDNMNAYFGGNGFAISDRRDIERPRFANLWGVSDQDLFQHALGYFDERAREVRPFFSILMSPSIHKPFSSEVRLGGKEGVSTVRSSW